MLLSIENQLPVQAVLCERSLLEEAGGFDESLPVLEDWELWLRLFERVPPLRVPRVTSEVRRPLDASNLSGRHHAIFSEVRARIYARTFEREREDPALRSHRIRHLLDLVPLGHPFPREALEWLAGGAGLPPIDPDDPTAALS